MCHHRAMTAAAPRPMTDSTTTGKTSRAVPRAGASGLADAPAGAGCAGAGSGPDGCGGRAARPARIPRAGLAIRAAPRAGDRTDVQARSPAGAAPRPGPASALAAAGRDLLAAGRLDSGSPGNPPGWPWRSLLVGPGRKRAGWHAPGSSEPRTPPPGDTCAAPERFALRRVRNRSLRNPRRRGGAAVPRSRGLKRAGQERAGGHGPEVTQRSRRDRGAGGTGGTARRGGLIAVLDEAGDLDRYRMSPPEGPW